MVIQIALQKKLVSIAIFHEFLMSSVNLKIINNKLLILAFITGTYMTMDQKISHFKKQKVLMKCLHSNILYSAILYRKPTKRVTQNEQLSLHLDN